MKQLFGLLCFVLTVLLFSPNVAFAITNESSDDGDVCLTGSALNASVGSSCRTTPTVYEISIYEMGFCSSHPYGASKVSASFDSSTCIVTYSDAAPTAVDIAASIGSSTPLSGTSTPPTEGTYSYPYMIMGSSFDVAGNVTNSLGTVYYGTSAGGVTTSDGSAGTRTETLTNFGGSTCSSGYVGAAVSGGTIDGFITDSNKDRSISTEVSAGVCDNSGRVVGVMTLSSPVVVTSKTYGVTFTFMLTNFGIQFIDLTVGDGGDGDADVPEEFGSAPFSGYFTVFNAE